MTTIDPNRAWRAGNVAPRIAVAVEALVLAGALATPARHGGPASAPRHDPQFWRAIAQGGFRVPPGESPDALLLELSLYLGSPDPELRDGYAYEILAAWIYRDHRVQDETLHRLLADWSGNLRQGLGDQGSDSVLLRSFSALALSVLAALENERPFMSQEEYSRLLAAGLAYLEGERDLRGYDPVKGWIHATAHTADLLKFVGRSPKLTPAQQRQILDAVAAKIQAVGDAFTHGENERMAAAVQSVILRADLDPSGFDQFLAHLAEAGEHLRDEGPRVDVRRLASVLNGKDLLRSLYVGLAAREPAAICGEGRRGDVLRTLKRMP
jgi:hypothetical protein